MKLVADDVRGLLIPGCGHWLAEEAPKEMLAALTTFLAHTGAKLRNCARSAEGVQPGTVTGDTRA